MENKLVGVLNIVFGAITLFVLVSLMSTYPKVMEMYQSLNVDIPTQTIIFPAYNSIFIILAISQIVFGCYLIAKKKVSGFLHKVGIGLVIMDIVLAILMTIVGYFSIIQPIYQLTKAF